MVKIAKQYLLTLKTRVRRSASAPKEADLRVLRQRLSAHGVKATDLVLLMPGGELVEQEMHARFAHLLAEGPGLGVEHFRLEQDLLDFINERRIDMGLNSLVA